MGDQGLPELLQDYFKELDEHIVGRIHSGKVGDSCFAAMMFICAAIDSLGCLIAPSGVESEVHKRFTYVVERYFPSIYFQREQCLWGLRNDLMHNALNVATFLAAMQEPEVAYEHLDLVPHTKYLSVNTSIFHEDLSAAAERVKKVLQDPKEAQNAVRRLERVAIPAYEEPPTPPAVVMFRQR